MRPPKTYLLLKMTIILFIIISFQPDFVYPLNKKQATFCKAACDRNVYYYKSELYAYISSVSAR